MYEKKALQNASVAAFGIGTWCQAIIKYFEAMKIVRPKEEQLKVAKEASAVAEASRAAAQAKLDEVNARLKALVDDLEAKRKEEQMLKDDKEKKEAKLKLAELLMTSLKSERESWDKLLVQNKADKLNLEGDILISSGIMAYLGVFTMEYRLQCIDSWVQLLNKFQIKSTENVNLINVLGDQVKIGKWCS